MFLGFHPYTCFYLIGKNLLTLLHVRLCHMFPSELTAVRTFCPSPSWQELAGGTVLEALPFIVNYFTVNQYFKLLVIELDGMWQIKIVFTKL